MSMNSDDCGLKLTLYNSFDPLHEIDKDVYNVSSSKGLVINDICTIESLKYIDFVDCNVEKEVCESVDRFLICNGDEGICDGVNIVIMFDAPEQDDKKVVFEIPKT